MIDIVFVVAPKVVPSAERVVALLRERRVAPSVILTTLIEQDEYAGTSDVLCLRSTCSETFVCAIVEKARSVGARSGAVRIGLVCIHDRLLNFVLDAQAVIDRVHATSVQVVLRLPEGMAKLRDKAWLENWRARSDREGRATPRSAVFDLGESAGVAALETWLAERPHGFEFVAKPALGTQSVAVLRFKKGASLAAYVARVCLEALDVDQTRYGLPVSLPTNRQSDTRFVVQPVVAGVEVSIDGRVHDGKASFILHRKTQAKAATVFARDEWLLAPFDASTGLTIDATEIKLLLEDVFEAAGVRSWPFHAEAIINPAGVFLLEVNARPAGGLIPESVLRLTGVDLFATLVDALLGRELRDVCAEPRLHTCEVTVYPPSSGIVQHVRGLDALPELRGYVAHRVFVHPGDEVIVENREEYGVIAVMSGVCEDEALGAAQAVLDTVRIEVRV